MEQSWMILTFVSQGMIVFYWLTTLAIPFSSLFLCSSCWGHDHEYDWPWFKRFLYNVIPAISSTSIFLIISATSLLAVCNRWFESTSIFFKSIKFWTRSIVSLVLMTKLALLYAGFSWTSYQAFQVLNHLFGVEWTWTPFLIAQRSLSPLMLLLTAIGAIWTLTQIMKGKDQHESVRQEEQHQRRRWKTLLVIFTLVLIASWILLSGLQVSFKCKNIPLLQSWDLSRPSQLAVVQNLCHLRKFSRKTTRFLA